MHTNCIFYEKIAFLVDLEENYTIFFEKNRQKRFTENESGVRMKPLIMLQRAHHAFLRVVSKLILRGDEYFGQKI